MCADYFQDQHKHPATPTSEQQFTRHKHQYVAWARRIVLADQAASATDHIKRTLSAEIATPTHREAMLRGFIPTKPKRALH